MSEIEEKILSSSCLYNRKARGMGAQCFIYINMESENTRKWRRQLKHTKREKLQTESLFLCYSPGEYRHTKKTLLLTGSGSGELEVGMAAGGCIFLFSVGTVLGEAGATVRLSVSAGLIVSLTTDLDVFRRLINWMIKRKAYENYNWIVQLQTKNKAEKQFCKLELLVTTLQVFS